MMMMMIKIKKTKDIQCLLVEKRRAYNRHLQENTAFMEAAFKSIKFKVQREIRFMTDKQWSKEAEGLQEMADKNDLHGVFGGPEAIYGTRSNTVAPVKNTDGSQFLTYIDDIKGGRNTSAISSTNMVHGTADPHNVGRPCFSPPNSFYCYSSFYSAPWQHQRS